jgi:hypothetical protein
MTLSRLMGEHKRIRLETDRSTYGVDGQCRLYAHVMDESFEPVVQPGFDTYVSNLASELPKQLVKLRPHKAQPGLYEGYFSPPETGRYRLEANEEDGKTSNTTEFQVVEVREELIETDLGLPYLERIAQLTGGAILTPREWPMLSSLVNDRLIRTELRSERPLWDNWVVALLLVALLGAEWIQRRRYDLR